MSDLVEKKDVLKILEDLWKTHLQFCYVPFRQAIEMVQALPSIGIPQEEQMDVIRNAFCDDCKGYRYDICEYKKSCNTMNVLDKLERSRR